MNAGRTTKQGQQINVGKDSADYQAIVSTLTMHAEDMKAIGVAEGGRVRVRSQTGEGLFQCKVGKVPQGMVARSDWAGELLTWPPESYEDFG